MNPAFEQIKELIRNNNVMLFMKGERLEPETQCGFSGRVCQILDQLGVKYETFNVMSSPEIRQGLKEYSNWPTFPQLYVKGELIGGHDILVDMFESDELKQLFVERGVLAA